MNMDNDVKGHACKTCEGEGTVLLDCKEPVKGDCLDGGNGALAGHSLECPCCEGSGFIPESAPEGN